MFKFMSTFLNNSKNRKKNRKKALNLYKKAMDASRNEYFYIKCSVEDTVDGRFDMLALFLSIIYENLKTIDNTNDLRQELSNVIIADMDVSFRNTGLGDVAVAKRVKKTFQAFWGRFNAYYNKKDDELLKTINKNIFRENKEKEKKSKMIKKIIEKQRMYLESVKKEEFLMGNFDFKI